jgi:hypothetical protein
MSPWCQITNTFGIYRSLVIRISTLILEIDLLEVSYPALVSFRNVKYAHRFCFMMIHVHFQAV